MLNRIISHTRIRHHAISVNDREIYKADPSLTLQQFLSEAYRHMDLQYPKFHKMDALCKLGMLCAEPVVKGMQQADLSKVAIVLSNNASSLDTDRQHQRSIADHDHYLPSPAVFVYTLPNIVIGELAIRYKITGENAFFVSGHFDADLLTSYTDALLNTEQAEAALCGWINADGPVYDALIYLVEKPTDSNKNSTFKPHSPETVNQLYY